MQVRMLLLAAVILTGGTGRAQPAQAAQNTVPPFSVKIAAIPAVARVGSPIVVGIVATNTSSHKIDLNWTFNHYGEMYRMDIQNSEGRPVPQAKPKPGAYQTGSGSSSSLEPGQIIEDQYPLEKRFDLSHPGTYTIQAARYDYETKTFVKSNTVTMTVEDASEYDRHFADARTPFLLTLGTSGDTVKAGSEIALPMYTTNVSDHEITFDCAKFDIQAYDAQGNSLPRIGSRELRKVIEAGNGLACRVAPYGTVGGVLPHIEKWYDLSKSGGYTIQAARFDDETKTWVKSNIITVTVTP